jgi:uncharacterized membrane protein YiaA
MEEHLCKVAYWIGIICTVLALLTRGLAMLGIWTATLAGPSRKLLQESDRSRLK